MARTRLLALGVSLSLFAIPGPSLGGGGKQEAKERFEKGVGLFKDGDFEAALVEFRAAYEAMPHYGVRYNLGVTLQNLHRYAEAMEEFVAFLDEGGSKIGKKKRQEVEGFIEELESLVSTLRITCNVEGARLFLNGTFQRDLVLENEILLDLGEYDLEIRLEGWQTHYAKIDVPGGRVIDMAVELVEVAPEEPEPVVAEPEEPEPLPVPVAPVQAPRRRSPAAFWSLLGVTLASGAAAGALGGTFLAKKKDFEDAGPVEGWQEDRKELQGLALGADLMIGLTGALAVATVVIGVVTLRREKPGVALSPMLEGPGLVVGGTF
jgi:hypothetical protein